MIHLDPRALEAGARALFVHSFVSETAKPHFRWEDVGAAPKRNVQEKARAAVTAYLQSAPPEIRIGQFVIRHAPNGIWIGRTDGEGGEFAAADVEHAIAQFYRANF